MPSINLRQLRDTRQLKAWLKAGKTVELRERDQAIAVIIPETDNALRMPDFEARAYQTFGARRRSKNTVVAMRREEPY